MSRTLRLSEIATIQSGYSFRVKVVSVDGGSLGVVQAKDINGLYVDEDGIAKINQPYAESRIQKTGDVLLTSRGSFRAGVSKFIKPTIASSSLFTIRLTSEDVLPEYLAIYLNSEPAQYYFSLNAKGATIQSLAITDLQNLNVPIVPLASQRIIIDLQQNVESQRNILNRKQDIINQVLKSSVAKTLEGATKWQ